MNEAMIAWYRLSRDIWRAALDAQVVLGLRFALIARGGRPAAREAKRMVTEKIATALVAGSAINTALVMGRPGKAASLGLAPYKKRITRNRKRLSR